MIHEVVGPSSTAAGKGFRDWVMRGRMRLVAGGGLLQELAKTPARDWVREAISAGRMRTVGKDKVNAKTDELERLGACGSNDAHVIALAQISGARLLYTNDRALQRDFNCKSLIDSPRGKVYSTTVNKAFTTAHKRLLARRDLCRI